jgi:hypothetical protein
MKTDKKSKTALRPKPIKVKSQVSDSEIIFIFANHNQSLIRA